jgi:glycosyltransferase involved in cell wall biosynthesis
VSGRAQPIRVLHVASGDGWGGAEVVIAELLRGQRVAAGIDVEAVLLNEGALATRLRALGVPVRIIDERGHSFVALARAIRRAVSVSAPHVVHAHRYKELLLTLAAGGRLARVATIHGLQPLAQLDMRSRLQIWSALWLARARGTHFAAVSPELVRRLARLFGTDHVHAVPNPMPAPTPGPAPDWRARLGWPEDVPVVAFAGRLEPVKGPDRLLDAVERCRGGARFVVMGEGSMAEALRQRVAATPALAERVALVGEVEEPARSFPTLDALVVPSRHEGQPMVVLEAADAGCPVVAYAVGGLPDLLADAPLAWSVAPGDAGALAAAVDAVVTDPVEQRRAAARWGAALRSRHGLDAVVAAYLALYDAARAAPPTGAEAAQAPPAA